MKLKNSVDDLSRFKILSYLTEEEIQAFKNHLFQRTYKKNQLLFTVGDPRERIYLLSIGYVKLERTNTDATMLYLDYVKPHDLFPYGGMFKDAYYHYSAYALTDIVVYYIPTKIFEDIVQTNKDQLLYIVYRLSRILELHERRLQTITTSNVKDRVEQSITYLVEEFGIQMGNDIVIDVPMTITEIAKISGTSRETASHVFKELRCDGFLTMEGRQIIVHDVEYFKEKVQ